jgi:DNA polymerase epsilon subunit 2
MKVSMLRKKVERKCKIRGYILKMEALEEILSFVDRFPGAEDDAVDLLLDQLDTDSRNFSLFSPFLFS